MRKSLSLTRREAPRVDVVGQRRAVLRETLELLQSHYGYVPFRPVHAYASCLLDRRDQFFEPLRPSILKYVVSLLVGLRYNPGRPFRFTREWAAEARRWRTDYRETLLIPSVWCVMHPEWTTPGA